eukprot:1663775-Amphidinium_carterae.1
MASIECVLVLLKLRPRKTQQKTQVILLISILGVFLGRSFTTLSPSGVPCEAQQEVESELNILRQLDWPTLVFLVDAWVTSKDCVHGSSSTVHDPMASATKCVYHPTVFNYGRSK